jgi:hypothetical protein
MTSQPKVLDDGTVGGEKMLGLSWRFEALHAPFRWRVGWWEFSAQLLRYIHQSPEEFPAELLRGGFIALALDQHIQARGQPDPRLARDRGTPHPNATCPQAEAAGAGAEWHMVGQTCDTTNE